MACKVKLPKVIKLMAFFKFINDTVRVNVWFKYVVVLLCAVKAYTWIAVSL